MSNLWNTWSTFISQSSAHFRFTLGVWLTSDQVKRQSEHQVSCDFWVHLTVTFQDSEVTKQTEVTVKWPQNITNYSRAWSEPNSQSNPKVSWTLTNEHAPGVITALTWQYTRSSWEITWRGNTGTIPRQSIQFLWRQPRQRSRLLSQKIRWVWELAELGFRQCILITTVSVKWGLETRIGKKFSFDV